MSTASSCMPSLKQSLAPVAQGIRARRVIGLSMKPLPNIARAGRTDRT